MRRGEPTTARSRGRSDTYEIITPENFCATARAFGWNLDGQLRWSHDPFVPRNGKIPDASRTPPGSRYPEIRQVLQRWQADLGARDRMDWSGFLREYRKHLRPLVSFPTLGKLREAQVDEVVRVVNALETYKETSGRALVFGSKTAHFHFPGLVPIISSEVRRALLALQRSHPELIARHLEGDGAWFKFTTAADTTRSYANYVALGNALMRRVDCETFLGRSLEYPMHAKIFEWCIASHDPSVREV